MRHFIFISFFALMFSADSLAQSRRIPPPRPSAAPTNAENAGSNNSAAASPVVIEGQTAAQMYEDAKTYAKRKFDEFANKKVPYSEELRERTQLEGKQLAAKYAAQLQTKKLSDEDLYYLGSLHIIAENTDGASEAFKRFLTAAAAPNPEKAQTARAFVVVTAARKKDFPAAETALSEYLKNKPIVLRERVLVENELAQQYFAVKNYAAAAAHADAAVVTGQPAIKDAYVEPRLLEIFSEAGFTLFDIYAESKTNEKAAATLEILRTAGATAQSVGLYSRATGKLISFLIEAGRKPEALQILKTTQDAVNSNFRDPATRAQVVSFLKNREKQYKILGEAAPEINVDRWVTDKNADESDANSLAGMRGKVVLLDFWATWCKPCFAAFPHLTEWHQTYSRQGLKIIGMTRYYGTAGGLSADENGEFTFLQQFKRTERLPYPFAIAGNLKNHNNYAVFALPTVILIDKKGIVRYVETGVRNEKEVETVIQKLLAEN